MTSTIKIERLTVGTLIAIPSYDAVEVYRVEFDGEGYAVDVCTNDRGGWAALDCIYVEAGGSVEFAGRGEPSLRSEADVNRAEWEAKTEANDARVAVIGAQLVRLHAETFALSTLPRERDVPALAGE